MGTPDSDKSPWKTTKTEVGYKSKWLSVESNTVLRPDGSPGTYDVVKIPDFVLIIPKDLDGFWLVRQYRYPVSSFSWEFPKGIIEDKEDPKEAAYRELEEEVGKIAGAMKPLCSLWPANGRLNNSSHFFLAENLTNGVQNLDPTETEMKTGKFTLPQIYQMVSRGEVKDGSTVAALGLYIGTILYPPSPLKP